jgi:hypothetical protein
LQSTPESGARAGYDGYKRKKGSKVPIAVDMLGHLLALKVTPANEQERAQVKDLLAEVQEVTGGSVQAAFVDQGDTGEEPAAQAAKHGVELIVVKLAEARRGDSSCCPDAGSWSAPLLGRAASADWREIMNDYICQSQASTGSLS